MTADTTDRPGITKDDVDALLEFTDDEFAEVVAQALGDDDAEEDWLCLFAGPVVLRTMDVLRRMRMLVDAEIDRLERDPHADFRAVRRTRRRRHVIVRRCRQGAEARNRYRNDQHGRTRLAAALLAGAIQRHRLASVTAGLEPEPADRALWAVLDQVVVPYKDGEATAAELLGLGVWGGKPAPAGEREQP